MKCSSNIPAVGVLLYCTVSGSALAQGPAPVLVDISPCMNLAVSAERYACYDKLEDAVRAAQRGTPQVAGEPSDARPAAPARDIPVAAAPAAPAQDVATPVASFGQETPASAEAAKVVANQDGEEELHDRIVSVQEREPGRQLITLESGQVWYQSNSQRFRLVKGMAVRIYPSPLRGSYRLARDDGKETGFIQVERVQ